MTYFVGQQICFFGGLAICIALRPDGLGANAGISYYGTFGDTFPFYLMSLLGTATFSLLTARLISLPDLKKLRVGLLAFGLLLIAIAFTPYFVSMFMDLLHTAAGIILFIVQLALSFWLLARLQWAIWPLFFVSLEMVAGAISLIYVLPSYGFLIQGQICFQAAFAALLFMGFKELLPASGT